MTNPVFDDNERDRWLADPQVGADPRFTAVLRIDPMLRDYAVGGEAHGRVGLRRTEEIGPRRRGGPAVPARLDRQAEGDLPGGQPAAGLPLPGRGEDGDVDGRRRRRQAMLEEVVLPVCAERGLPFAMMIGSRLRVNPALGDAGDMVGKADVLSVVNLCRQFPDNKFFVTMLARENQHELCVAARKFGNLMVFGCWWFLNNPSLIEEIERMRLELLGTSFIPQHSDARVLDQLIYKWDHSRQVIGKVLTDKYADLARTGFRVTDEHVRRDVRLLLRDNFLDFLGR